MEVAGNGWPGGAAGWWGATPANEEHLAQGNPAFPGAPGQSQRPPHADGQEHDENREAQRLDDGLRHPTPAAQCQTKITPH